MKSLGSELQHAPRVVRGHQADVTVVGGAGHVGVPLILALAQAGLQVNVNDINRQSLDALASGRLPFMEEGGEDLLKTALSDNRLIFTNRADHISPTGPVIITIGTPVDEFLNPERKAIQACIEALLPALTDGQLLVLRSTVFPGTTDWVHNFLKARGRNLKVAFCPERVVQGYGIRELREMPQIISGTTPEATEEAAALFKLLAPELITVTPMEAEFAKLFNNAYRYIQFAAANEFYVIAQSAGIDYRNVLRALRHNYPRAQHLPGPGFTAGPCLLKDTMQLAAFARNTFRLGNAAMLANEGLALNVVEDLRRRYDLSKMTVGLLGMAFKANIDDTRSSLSYKIKKVAASYAHQVITTDPFVTTDPELLPLDEVISRSDLLILCTPHNEYLRADLRGKPVFDVWGVLKHANVISLGQGVAW